LKAEVESSLSQLSFKRINPGGFNTDFIASVQAVPPYLDVDDGEKDARIQEHHAPPHAYGRNSTLKAKLECSSSHCSFKRWNLRVSSINTGLK
jgi:hypothetical protein